MTARLTRSSRAASSSVREGGVEEEADMSEEGQIEESDAVLSQSHRPVEGLHGSTL